jgi:transcriptional regulator with XRE-family HTH domain
MSDRYPIGTLLRAARESRGWNFGDVAAAIGMRRAKAWRLANLERGTFDRRLFDRVASVLELDPDQVDAALANLESRWAEEDRLAGERESREWIANWRGPFYRWKAMAGVGVTQYAPEGITAEADLERWAIALGRSEGMLHTTLWRRTFLRGGKIVQREDFHPGESFEPVTRIGNDQLTSMFEVGGTDQ